MRLINDSIGGLLLCTPDQNIARHSLTGTLPEGATLSEFMSPPVSYFSVLIKDTCVLVVVAYLLARGRGLSMLFRERLSLRETVTLGVGLGLVGLTSTVFPEAQFHYVTHTLFVIFATLIGGPPVGLLTAAVVSLGIAFQTPRLLVSLLFAVALSALLAHRMRRSDRLPVRLLIGFAAGALAQTFHLAVRTALAAYLHRRALPPTALFSIPGNGFGVALLLLVVSDAQARADSEQRRREVERQRMEAERAHALASEAQLAALRARVHPHFLFNALNSITELCCIAPRRAEAACLSLSHLMRRALETSVTATTLLCEELALAQAYVQIEQERLGERLKVKWQIDPAGETVPVVPFMVQTLVENAIRHGLASKVTCGTVTILVRCRKKYTLVAVCDDGIGMTLEERCHALPQTSAPTHGLPILDQQMRLLYGDRGRLRLFSQINRGTLAAVAVPTEAWEPQPRVR